MTNKKKENENKSVGLVKRMLMGKDVDGEDALEEDYIGNEQRCGGGGGGGT